jgi:hypothetical protein
MLQLLQKELVIWDLLENIYLTLRLVLLLNNPQNSEIFFVKI